MGAYAPTWAVSLLTFGYSQKGVGACEILSCWYVLQWELTALCSRWESIVTVGLENLTSVSATLTWGYFELVATETTKRRERSLLLSAVIKILVARLKPAFLRNFWNWFPSTKGAISLLLAEGQKAVCCAYLHTKVHVGLLSSSILKYSLHISESTWLCTPRPSHCKLLQPRSFSLHCYSFLWSCCFGCVVFFLASSLALSVGHLFLSPHGQVQSTGHV